MASTNTKSKTTLYEPTTRLAGGFGARAAAQPNEALLRRVVMTNLLWEKNAYADGTSIADEIKRLVPLVRADVVAAIAVEARTVQKLRHVPLFIVREMARHASHKHLVSETLATVIRRPDEMGEYLSLYWKDEKRALTGTAPKRISAQSKRGLAAAFTKFDEYQLGKYNRAKDITLKNILRLVHPVPKDENQSALWKRLINHQLATPDTWEVGLSAAKTKDDKKAVWERLIKAGKLGASAFLKNLRNMESAGVSRSTIAEGFDNLKSDMLLPLDFLRAAKHAPDWIREIESAMLKCAGAWPKLPGWTIMVVDVSGSMGHALSDKSDFKRYDAALAMAVLGSEMCEHISIYATAGSDNTRTHKTEKIKALRGFALSDHVNSRIPYLGGGGIFTRQCLEYIRSQEKETPDRIIVFSDSQDCDRYNSAPPKPFGKKNYIVDVSPHKNGVAYRGIWTAEIAGWSEHFLKFISALESEPMN